MDDLGGTREDTPARRQAHCSEHVTSNEIAIQLDILQSQFPSQRGNLDVILLQIENVLAEDLLEGWSTSMSVVVLLWVSISVYLPEMITCLAMGYVVVEGGARRPW